MVLRKEACCWRLSVIKPTVEYTDTFTNAKPWLYDPENYRTSDNTNALGKYKSVPQAKSINVGLNLKF